MLQSAALMLCASCAVAACSSTHFDFDVFVSGNVVEILAGNADLDCSCDGPRLPMPESCTYYTDVRTCDPKQCHTCFTDMGLESSGMRVATGSTQSGILVTDIPLHADLELVITGCDYGPMRIPLQVDSYPMPTVTADVGSQGVVTATWTTDVPATSAIVSLGNTFDGEECLVENANVYTFDLHGGTGTTIGVDAYADTPTYKTPLGTARVWSGGKGSTTLMDAQPTCEPLTQTGCASGEKCTWIIDMADAASSIGHIGCAPAGDKAAGGQCTRNAPGATGYDDCVRGDYCLGPDTGGPGTCAVICDLAGGGPSCPGATTCSAHAPMFGQPPTAGVCGA